MSYILNIESATAICSVSLSKNDETVFIREVKEGMQHAKLLTVFVEALLKQAGISVKTLAAVAVSSGPGSYTGLRIGHSVAKGICFSADLPLIQIASLDIIAFGIKQDSGHEILENDLIYPMIDARRMEVYTACFDHTAIRSAEDYALIIESSEFFESLGNRNTYLGGDGSLKFKSFQKDYPNLKFTDILSSSKYMAKLANEKFQRQDFVDLAYSEPFYLKEFKAGIPRSQL